MTIKQDSNLYKMKLSELFTRDSMKKSDSKNFPFKREMYNKINDHKVYSVYFQLPGETRVQEW